MIELQYHSELNRIFLFKCYYNTTDREIRVDLNHGFVKINIKVRLYNVDDFLFLSSNANKLITYTLIHLKGIFLGLICYL